MFYHPRISLKLPDSRNSCQTKKCRKWSYGYSDMDTETVLKAHIRIEWDKASTYHQQHTCILFCHVFDQFK